MKTTMTEAEMRKTARAVWPELRWRTSPKGNFGPTLFGWWGDNDGRLSEQHSSWLHVEVSPTIDGVYYVEVSASSGSGCPGFGCSLDEAEPFMDAHGATLEQALTSARVECRRVIMRRATAFGAVSIPNHRTQPAGVHCA